MAPLGWGGGFGTCHKCGKYERVTRREIRGELRGTCWKCLPPVEKRAAHERAKQRRRMNL